MTPELFDESGGDVCPVEHFVDDPEIIYRWEIGSLSPEEQETYIEHYVRCSYCRNRLQELFPEVGELSPSVFQKAWEMMPTSAVVDVRALKAEALSKAEKDGSERKRTLYRLLAGVAALALISVIVLSIQTPEPDLTAVDQDLKNGNYWSAWRQMESMKKEFRPKSKKFRRLFEETGYLLARDCLRQGDMKEIAAISGKLEESESFSGRMLNLKIQAERQQHDEYAISSKKYLTDYGIALTGNSFIKGAGETRNEETRFAEAVKRFPDARSLRLNYAQYLLESNQATGAEREAGVLLEQNLDDSQARNILGMALFRQGKFVEAKDVFLQMLEKNRVQEETLVNLAICCMRLDESGQAAIYFEQALKYTTDANMKRLVEEHLEQLVEACSQ